MARISVEASGAQAFDVIGVQDGPNFSESGPWLQAVLLPPGTIGISLYSGSRSDIFLSMRLTERLGHQCQERLQHAVKIAHESLVQQLGIEPPGRFLLADGEEGFSAHSSGAAMTVLPGTYDLLESGEFPELLLYNAVLTVCRLWWGAGCRVAGSDGRVVEAGLAAGLAIHLVRSLGYGDGLANIIARFQAYAANSSKPSIGDTAAVQKTPQMARYTLAVASALEAGRIDSFARLTREQWGRYCSPSVLADSLGLTV